MANEGKECTFKPKINQHKGKVRTNGVSIEDRNKLWQQKKDEKIQRERELR